MIVQDILNVHLGILLTTLCSLVKVRGPCIRFTVCRLECDQQLTRVVYKLEVLNILYPRGIFFFFLLKHFGLKKSGKKN